MGWKKSLSLSSLGMNITLIVFCSTFFAFGKGASVGWFHFQKPTHKLKNYVWHEHLPNCDSVVRLIGLLLRLLFHSWPPTRGLQTQSSDSLWPQKQDQLRVVPASWFSDSGTPNNLKVIFLTSSFLRDGNRETRRGEAAYLLQVK